MTEVVQPYFQCAEADAAAKNAGEDIKTPGGWTPVDPTDPHVIEIGKFAIDTYNQKVHRYKLIFVKVEKGRKQIIVGGVNYSIIIAARIKMAVETPPHLFQAIVFEHTSGKKELKSLVPVDRTI